MAESLDSKLAEGNYAKKQIFCSNWVIKWSHRSRFDLAARLVAPFHDASLLDYGCGDGTFLATVAGSLKEGIGAELSPILVENCQKRFADTPKLQFLHTTALAGPEYNQRFDLITCMEVMEHCIPSVLDDLLKDLGRLLAPKGTLMVSVPIEIGISLVGKELVRGLAAWRNQRHHSPNERYSWGEMATMLFAGPNTAIERPQYQVGDPNDPSYVPFHGHKGFNWKALRERISRDFAIERTLFSPMAFAGSLVNSQVWMICRHKPAG